MLGTYNFTTHTYRPCRGHVSQSHSRVYKLLVSTFHTLYTLNLAAVELPHAAQKIGQWVIKHNSVSRSLKKKNHSLPSAAPVCVIRNFFSFFLILSYNLTSSFSGLLHSFQSQPFSLSSYEMLVISPFVSSTSFDSLKFLSLIPSSIFDQKHFIFDQKHCYLSWRNKKESHCFLTLLLKISFLSISPWGQDNPRGNIAPDAIYVLLYSLRLLFSNAQTFCCHHLVY